MPHSEANPSQSLPRLSSGLLKPGGLASNNVILGLGAFGHDSAAAIVDEATGEVLFAVAEERLTNKKHDSHFPVGAVHQCFQEAVRLGKSLSGVVVNFRYEEFVTKTLFDELDRLSQSSASVVMLKGLLVDLLPSAEYYSFDVPNTTSRLINDRLGSLDLDDATKTAMARRISWYFNWAVKYRNIDRMIRQSFEGIPIHFINHHLSHAASSFYSSGYREATVLVMDGSGEADTVTVYRGVENDLQLVSRTGWPHSLGIFYLFATQHLGFGLGDEYKVMGMSAYGRPRFAPMLHEVMSVTSDARLRQAETEYQVLGDLGNTGHVAYQFSDRLREILPVRQKGEPFRQEHFDFAASIQQLTEETGVALAQRAMEITGLRNLAIAGGVGLNGLMNDAIRRRSGCQDLFVYPAASDDGCAVGAAQWLAAQKFKLPKRRLKSCYFGQAVEGDTIERICRERGIVFTEPDSIHQQIASALADGKIVARCHGRAEFGPRALGHRSILAHPGLATMKETLNLRVKHREEFRPFAPACLEENVHEYFDIDVSAPFMLVIARAKEMARQKVPAVVHADGTARVQSVSAIDNSDFYQIIAAFEARTGLPIVLNTSFNVNGETIVDNPLDAIESFGFMDIDFLAIGPYWISKADNQSKFPPLSHEDYLEIRQKRFCDRQLGPLTEIDMANFDRAFFLNTDTLDPWKANLTPHTETKSKLKPKSELTNS